MSDIERLDGYLSKAAETPEGSPVHVFDLLAAIGVLEEMGTGRVEQELESLPPKGAGSDVEERRREAIEEALPHLRAHRELVLGGLSHGAQHCEGIPHDPTRAREL